MKIIRYQYKSLAEVYCSCCMEDHTLRFDLCTDYHNDSEHDALYIVIKDYAKYGLRDRLNRAWNFIWNWKKYIDGDNINAHGIFMRKEQIKELYPILRDKLREYDIITDLEVVEIETGKFDPFYNVKDINVVWRSKKGKSKTVERIFIPFIGDGFLISINTCEGKNNELHMVQEITFGYHLNKHTTRKDAWRMAFYHLFYHSNDFIGGDFEGFIKKDNVIQMLKVLYYFS